MCNLDSAKLNSLQGVTTRYNPKGTARTMLQGFAEKEEKKTKCVTWWIYLIYLFSHSRVQENSLSATAISYAKDIHLP